MLNSLRRFHIMMTSILVGLLINYYFSIKVSDTIRRHLDNLGALQSQPLCSRVFLFIYCIGFQ